MTSLGAVQPDSLPVRCTPTSLGCSTSHGRPAITSPQSAPPTPMASMPSPPALGVCESAPIISAPGERVVLQHDLVDDARARLPEAEAVLARRRADEVVDLLALADRALRGRRPRRSRRGSGDRSACVEGTATRLRPDIMNWKSAICPVTSCSATRSTRSRRIALPRSHTWLSKSQQCATRIFSESVSGRPKRAARTGEAVGHGGVERAER